MKSSTVLMLLLVLLSARAQAAEELEQILENPGEPKSARPVAMPPKAREPVAEWLNKQLRKPKAEQNLFIRHLEVGAWDKALLQFGPAFEGTAFQKTANGRALFALLHVKAGLPVTGLELLFRLDKPGQVDEAIRKSQRESLPESHWSWSLAQVQWRRDFTAIFPASTEARLREVAIGSVTDRKALSKLYSTLPADSSARSLVAWQLVAALGADNQVEEAAKILAPLMKAKTPPVSQELMDLTAARLLFQRGQFSSAIKYYEKVGKDSEYWTDAQEETAWAYIRKGEPENALGVSQSLVTPGMAEQGRAESFFVHTLAQLKICDYSGVLRSLEAFPKIFKPRSETLARLSTSAGLPEIKKAVGQMMASAQVNRAALAAEAAHLPRLVTRDRRLLEYVQAGKGLSSEAQAADLVYAKSLALTGLQGYFDKLRQTSAQRAQKAVSAAENRVRELAVRENAEIKAVLRKLHIIEAEVIQQISVADRVVDKTRAVAIQKKGVTGAKGRDTVEFPAEEEVWFDEIGNYRVNVKKACHAQAKGKTT